VDLKFSLFARLFLSGLCIIALSLPLRAEQSDEYACHADDEGIASEEIVEKHFSSSQLWRSVQEQARDTVVQIFAQVAEADPLQPYNTPAQGGRCGSGFFIDADGYLLTNWHVVDQALAVWIQVPSLGKRFIEAEVVSVYPEADVALLRVADSDLVYLRDQLGQVPFLHLGDSDQLFRAEEVLALGYPLGQQSLKSTSGIISGREHHFIQMSAPINPGNSGGPLLNLQGEVVGINSAGIVFAQNVGYSIPINDVKMVLPAMRETRLLYKPELGGVGNNGGDALAESLGNPIPSGFYLTEIIVGSVLDRAGLQAGDMIYEIDGHRVDAFSEMTLPGLEDKLTLADYLARVAVGQELAIAYYRNGERQEVTAIFCHGVPAQIRKIYPGYEDETDELLQYEIFAGVVVRRLTVNIVEMLQGQVPGLGLYTMPDRQHKPALVVTHIFPSSQLFRLRAINVGCVLNEVNGVPVTSLAELREALKKSVAGQFLTLRVTDNTSRVSPNVHVALPWAKVLSEESVLARDYHYAMTDTMQELVGEAG